MRFEKVDASKVGMRIHRQECMEMLSEFVKSGIEVAEVKDWDTSYSSVGSAYVALRTIAERCFKGEIRISKGGGKLFIARI